MKKIFYTTHILLMALLFVFNACSKGEAEQDQGRPYRVTGTIQADSAFVLDHLLLIADNHSSLQFDTLRLDGDTVFSSSFMTAGIDELYLCCDSCELCRFYATGDMEVELSVSIDSVITTRFRQTAADTVNAWLKGMSKLMADQSEQRRHQIMDSVVASGDASFRTSLLLRDELLEFKDSLYVRQLLGSMSQEVKPEWLIKSIDNLLYAKSGFRDRSRRLVSASFDVKDDTVLFNMGANRSDYLLVYFWADYSEASVDTLQTLAKLYDKEYKDKRLQIMTCCLHAADSTWWSEKLGKLTGKHTWVKGGFSDPRITNWGIETVPSVLLLDMYNNQQQRNVWGEPLRKALDRLPKRYNP